MVITQIKEKTKSRCEVYIDDEFAFVLYKGELRIHKLKEGQEISGELYKEIMEKILPKRAKLRSMNLLTSKQYTRKQLEDKLRQGGYPQAVITEALDYVESFHYVDDLAYAIDFIEYNNEVKSRRRIEQDLATKGLSKDLITRAYEEWQEQGGCQDEIKQIKDLLRKKNFDGENADLKEKQKMTAFLFRRGFSYENICKAMQIDRE